MSSATSHPIEEQNTPASSTTKTENLDPNFKEWSQVYSYIELNPDSFTTWEDLLEITEGLEGGLCKASTLNALRLFRFSYDSFLDRFPLTHGYWIKYAQIEFKLGNTEQALAIYEKAITMLPYCVELWTQYAIFKSLVTPSIKEIRRFFEKGAATVGHHYLSHPFWDEYIKFEKEKGTVDHLMNVYQLVIQRPIHQYSKYFSEFAKFLSTADSSKIVSIRLYDSFKAEYFAQQKADQQSVEQSEDTHQETQPHSATPVSKTAQSGNNNDNNDNLDLFVKEKIAEHYNQVYQHIQDKVVARWTFESELQRHFFHVVYVPEDELVMWRRYLHFLEMGTEASVSFDELLSVYERSIVTFGHYEEFWLRYTRWLASHNPQNYDLLANVYRRAGYVLPIGRIQVRLQYALFEEVQGNVELAKCIYTSMLEALPTVTEIIIGYTSFIHRTESAQNAIRMLESKITELENQDESAKTFKQLKPTNTSSSSKSIDTEMTNSKDHDESKSSNKDDNGTTSNAEDLKYQGEQDLPALNVSLAKFYYDWLWSESKAISVFDKTVSLFPESYYAWREYLRFIIQVSSESVVEACLLDNNSSMATQNESTVIESGNITNEQNSKPARKKRGRPGSKSSVSKPDKPSSAVQNFSDSHFNQKLRVQTVYQKIKNEAQLEENEAKDLAHIYMTYLLSNASPASVNGQFENNNTVLEYFQVDIETHV